MIRSNNRHLLSFVSMIACLAIMSLACRFLVRPLIMAQDPDKPEVIIETEMLQQADLASEAADEPDPIKEPESEPVVQTPAFIEEPPEGSYELHFRVGSVIHKINLFNFEHEIYDIDEFNDGAGWLPERSYTIYWSQDDHTTIGRPLVIETLPDGEVLVFDEMPEDINTYNLGA